jgi:dUTP pyrophosphatase
MTAAFTLIMMALVYWLTRIDNNEIKQIVNTLANKFSADDTNRFASWYRDNYPVLKYAADDGIMTMYETFPIVGSIHSSGFDVMAAETVLLKPGQRRAIGTGISFEIPEGFEIQVRSRSGLAVKHGIMVFNSPGTVDQDYRGEVKVILFNADQNEFTVSRGDKIAQLVLARRVTTPVFTRVSDVNVTETERQDKGFGSSGI